jgi:CRP/FNR family transcriptional regulator
MQATNQAPILQMLENIPLLAELPVDNLRALANNTRFDHLKDNELIFYQGDPCERVYIVYSGRVKIIFHDRDGREVILEIINTGEIFGGAVLFFPAHPASARAMEQSNIASFPAEAYAKVLLNHSPSTHKLLKMLGERHLGMLNMQIMAGERVERRVAHILLKLAVRTGKETEEGTLITVPLSRLDLAEMACTTLETCIRTVSRFQKSGLITTKRGGYILVRNAKELEDLTG